MCVVISSLPIDYDLPVRSYGVPSARLSFMPCLVAFLAECNQVVEVERDFGPVNVVRRQFLNMMDFFRGSVDSALQTILT